MSTAGLVASKKLAERYSDVVRSLTADEWEAPSRCAGWSVKDLVAHTGSNFKVMVDPPAEDPGAPAPATTDERYVSNEGKMEKSFLNFKVFRVEQSGLSCQASTLA